MKIDVLAKQNKTNVRVNDDQQAGCKPFEDFYIKKTGKFLNVGERNLPSRENFNAEMIFVGLKKYF